MYSDLLSWQSCKVLCYWCSAYYQAQALFSSLCIFVGLTKLNLWLSSGSRVSRVSQWLAPLTRLGDAFWLLLLSFFWLYPTLKIQKYITPSLSLLVSSLSSVFSFVSSSYIIFGIRWSQALPKKTRSCIIHLGSKLKIIIIMKVAGSCYITGSNYTPSADVEQACRRERMEVEMGSSTPPPSSG